MKRIGLAYATREGQTRKIVHQVANTLFAQGFDVEIWDAKSQAPARSIHAYDALILAASVHGGSHEPEMVKFVKQNLAALQTIPAALLSVSLSQAGAELQGTTPEEHARFSASVQEVLHRFFQQTSWRPKHVKAVAGALLYSRYNFLVRFVMKQISKRAGGSTDTTRDHEYTNWLELNRFIAGVHQPIVAARDRL